MLAFPDMLVHAATKAGIACPPDADNYNMQDYPHFAVFCLFQLGQPMPRPGVHWDNAEVIASVPLEHITKVTPQELLDNGFEIGYPIP